ncbi:hypothetical protein RI367_002585, partial [Sorochytrium milnesiophthora]
MFRVVVSILYKCSLSWYRRSTSARSILALDYVVRFSRDPAPGMTSDAAAMAEFEMKSLPHSPSQNTIEHIDELENATHLAPARITQEMRATA